MCWKKQRRKFPPSAYRVSPRVLTPLRLLWGGKFASCLQWWLHVFVTRDCGVVVVPSAIQSACCIVHSLKYFITSESRTTTTTTTSILSLDYTGRVEAQQYESIACFRRHRCCCCCCWWDPNFEEDSPRCFRKRIDIKL